MMRTCPSSKRATTMCKLLDPRPAAAKVSLMGELMLYNHILLIPARFRGQSKNPSECALLSYISWVFTLTPPI